tara:strand:- start:6780 stop:6914 length:135 start_codon:yes stop_codon:yes gene_type:complete
LRNIERDKKVNEKLRGDGWKKENCEAYTVLKTLKGNLIFEGVFR